MRNNNQASLLEALTSDENKKRAGRAYNFERISGGGIYKKIERLFLAPNIYIPYLLYAKVGLAHWKRTPVKLFWGRTIRIPLQDYDYFKLYMYGGLDSYGDELKFTKFLIKNLGPDDVFYDIGANRGFYTFLAAELCKETHAFEPTVELTGIIRDNIHKNEGVTINTAVVSDIDGTVDFYTMASDVMNTMNPAQAEIISARTHSTTRKITVPSVTIDTYALKHAGPTVLKIDAEGAEAQIIEGAAKFLSSHTPVVAMEIWGKENKWELSMSAATKLREMGYRPFRLDDEGGLQEATGDLSALVSPQGGENFVFKK